MICTTENRMKRAQPPVTAAFKISVKSVICISEYDMQELYGKGFIQTRFQA